MQYKMIRTMLFLVLVLPLTTACGVDVAGILGQSADGDEAVIEAVEEATAAVEEPQIVLEGFFSSLGFTVNYPAEWVIDYDPVNGAVLASSQQTLDAFDLAGLPDFNALPADSTIVTIQALPFGVAVGTPMDYYDIIAESGSEDDPFTIGEAEAVSVGIYEGVTASLDVNADVLGNGSIDLYILRVDEETLGLMLGIASGDEVPTDVVEAIIASAQYQGTVFALEPTAAPVTATITVEEATETVEEATAIPMPTATVVPPTAEATAEMTPEMEATEEVAMATMAPSDGVELSEIFETEGFFARYPAGWVAEFVPSSGLTLATSQLVLDEFLNSDVPDFDLLGEGSVVMNVVPIPFPAGQGTPRDVFGLVATDSSDEIFTTGEAEDVVIGDYEGVRSPLTFTESATGQGAGDLYILRLNADAVMLVISVTASETSQRDVVEAILATVMIELQ